MQQSHGLARLLTHAMIHHPPKTDPRCSAVSLRPLSYLLFFSHFTSKSLVTLRPTRSYSTRPQGPSQNLCATKCNCAVADAKSAHSVHLWPTLWNVNYIMLSRRSNYVLAGVKSRSRSRSQENQEVSRSLSRLSLSRSRLGLASQPSTSRFTSKSSP